ncbi:collagen alpha-1(XXVII) chain A [Tachysurus ichikawai]
MDFSMDRAPDILQTLHYLNLLVLSLKNPLGTKDHPARLCRDLITCQHKFNDGTYWIDPNLGCPTDSIEVTCNFTRDGLTCLRPITVSKLEFRVQYVQMNFLHLLASRAEQRIIIHCLNITIWSSTPTQTPSKNAVRFMAWNGMMLEPEVLEDTCWHHDGLWRNAIFLFRVTEASLLPIKNIVNLPKTASMSRYHLEVGPVCFL